ncbi:MAG: RluA family pseudouridine synthase [Oscillospiraceae bacterium]|nr:RluA family pseudouridine synthase [Oscillospiraceae bacterium]
MAKKEILFTAKSPGGLLELLIENQPSKPRGKVKSELEHGLVSVDGRTVTKFNYLVKAGQQVRVGTYTPKYEKNKSPFLDIIYEDRDFLAINKPAGMLSIATEKEREETAYRLAADYLHGRIYILHRLDRDTSGVLVFAKNREIRDALQDNWDSSAKLRSYVAVTEGIPSPEQGRIENMLRETETHLVYIASKGEGKRAVTNYRVLKKNDTYALVDINIETGRKNQIRVHMSSLGCPIAGDKKYGAKTNPAHRLCLHANKLVIVHPFNGREITFESPVPKKILKLI